MKLTHLITLFLILSASWSAQATLTMAAAPTGVSSYTPPGVASTTDADADKPTIYGGTTTTTCATVDSTNTTTCDSCAGQTSLVPCNHNSVYATLKVHFSLTSSTALPVGTSIYFRNGTNPQQTPVAKSIVGTAIEIDMTWDELCLVVSGASCATATGASANVTIGVDTTGGSTTTTDTLIIRVVYNSIDATANTTVDICKPDGSGSSTQVNRGYCYYEIARGDSKVYTDQLTTVPTYPATSATGVNYSAVMFFYVDSTAGSLSGDPAKAALRTTALASITSASPNFSISLNTTAVPPTASDNRIMGLNNDTDYCFVLANQDSTGNIFFFTKATDYSPEKICGTPAKVVGLLDDKHCFIATAAFGSDMAPEVDTFRHFRNEYLLKSKWGQSFVQNYYKYSPPFANFIAQSETLRAGARVALWPLLLFAKCSLQFGVWLSLLMFLAASLLITFLLQRTRKA